MCFPLSWVFWRIFAVDSESALLVPELAWDSCPLRPGILSAAESSSTPFLAQILLGRKASLKLCRWDSTNGDKYDLNFSCEGLSSLFSLLPWIQWVDPEILFSLYFIFLIPNRIYLFCLVTSLCGIHNICCQGAWEVFALILAQLNLTWGSETQGVRRLNRGHSRVLRPWFFIYFLLPSTPPTYVLFQQNRAKKKKYTWTSWSPLVSLVASLV